uniref:Uncharacterized protein n=1 Tax=Rhizophora mucronata TaxID=61149 RepID=A0A2P2K6E1_RHIMU
MRQQAHDHFLSNELASLPSSFQKL